MHRLDRNSNAGGILLYIREDTLSTLLNTELFNEGLCIEIKIKKEMTFSFQIQSK